MSSRAAHHLVRRIAAVGSDTIVSAGTDYSKVQTDAIGRAAAFRLEAEALRERARRTNETVVRDQYLALADRWSVFASSLEAELMNRSAAAH